MAEALLVTKSGGGVTYTVDNITEPEWSQVLLHFDDANFYQTWAYGEVRWGKANLSHIVVKQDGQIIGMAQARIVRLPLLPAGVAYVFRGPIWKPRGESVGAERLSGVVDALANEYVKKRGLLLRILPNEIDMPGSPVIKVLTSAGFSRRPSTVGDRTIMIDLSPSLEELRKGLRRKWRQGLGYAEKNGLNLKCGKDKELYASALGIYEEMHDRKEFGQFVDMEEQGMMQEQLPDHLKMKIMVGESAAEPVAGLAWSTIGDTGLPLLAATGNKALKTFASYLLWWRMVEDMKNNGCTRCDVGGVDPEVNPGGYTFKTGLAGKYGSEVLFVGQFDLCGAFLSQFAVRLGEGLRGLLRRAKTSPRDIKRSLERRSKSKEKQDAAGSGNADG